MNKKSIALLASVLLLAACTPAEERQASDTVLEEHPEQMEQQVAEHSPEEGEDDMPAPGTYVAYNASMLADGHEKVLFFYASWCPICKSADAKLQAWYAAQQVPLTVYKVDYDAEADLKARYGVTYQHTFVRVDGEGNLIEKIQGPTDAQLQAMIGA